MATGKTKWFSAQKGYGYIRPDDGGPDLFVHHSEIRMKGYRQLETGQPVEFSVADSVKGPKAVNIRPLRPALAG